MEALTEVTLGVVGRCVEVLESFSHIGVNTHFVKCACIVRIFAACFELPTHFIHCMLISSISRMIKLQNLQGG